MNWEDADLAAFRFAYADGRFNDGVKIGHARIGKNLTDRPRPAMVAGCAVWLYSRPMAPPSHIEPTYKIELDRMVSDC